MDNDSTISRTNSILGENLLYQSIAAAFLVFFIGLGINIYYGESVEVAAIESAIQAIVLGVVYYVALRFWGS